MINKVTETTTKTTRPYKRTGKYSKRRGPKPSGTSWDANNVLAAINYLNDLNDADRNKAISFFN